MQPNLGGVAIESKHGEDKLIECQPNNWSLQARVGNF